MFFLKFWLLIIFLSAPFVAGASSSAIQSEGSQFRAKEIHKGLGVIWSLAFLNENQLLVSERSGKLSRIEIKSGGKTEKTTLRGLPKVIESGQGGLMDLALHPDFSTKPWVYVTYSGLDKNRKSTVTILARFQIQGSKVIRFEKLLETLSRGASSRHFGSRITFQKAKNGKIYLYVSVGDRGYRPNGQNLKTHAGSILRLYADGSVPKDNPFVGQTTALPETWSYGHRNPQGLFFDQASQKLWSNEHGPRGGDEINLIQKGKNYGWAKVSFGKEYVSLSFVGEARELPGLVSPVHQFTPSIAPGSLLVYSGKKFPEWKGNLFSGALKLLHLNRVVVNDSKFAKEERLFENQGLRIRDVVESPSGEIYFSVDDGRILKVEKI